MRGPHHPFHGFDERVPSLALLDQYAASLRREPIEASPPLAGLLDPAALDPAAALEAKRQPQLFSRLHQGGPAEVGCVTLPDRHVCRSFRRGKGSFAGIFRLRPASQDVHTSIA